ncbi:MAG: hypothetical protein WBC53_11215 [Phycisphaerae bacterium]
MPAKRRGQKSVVKAAEPSGDTMNIMWWPGVFGKIYASADKSRSPVEMWVAVTSHCAEIGEAIRSMNFSELMRAAAHTFCWMCSFVLKCRSTDVLVFKVNESFPSIVTAKYPDVCGHCLKNPCGCNPEEMDKHKDKAVRYREIIDRRKELHELPEQRSVSEWLNIFRRMYGHQIHLLTLESIGFHFLEEAGEELKALRALVQLKDAPDQLSGVDGTFLEQLATFEGLVGLYGTYGGHEPDLTKRDPENIRNRLVRAKIEMFIEFADTFSWLCSIVNKVMAIAKNCDDGACQFSQEPFPQWLQKVYLPQGKPLCPTCSKCPCECVFYNEVSTRAGAGGRSTKSGSLD